MKILDSPGTEVASYRVDAPFQEQTWREAAEQVAFNVFEPTLCSFGAGPFTSIPGSSKIPGTKCKLDNSTIGQTGDDSHSTIKETRF